MRGKILYIIIVMFAMEASPAYSQGKLEVEKFIDTHNETAKSKSTKGSMVTKETFLSGKTLKPYNLSLFHSMVLNGDKTAVDEVSECVNKDSKSALEKEEGKIGDKLYYGFYVFPSGSDKYKYVFYKNDAAKDDSKSELTIVYMEGATSLAELKKMFK